MLQRAKRTPIKGAFSIKMRGFVNVDGYLGFQGDRGLGEQEKKLEIGRVGDLKIEITRS